MNEIYTPNRLQILNSVRPVRREKPRRISIILLKVLFWITLIAGSLYAAYMAMD